jgi:hypothetical protein
MNRKFTRFVWLLFLFITLIGSMEVRANQFVLVFENQTKAEIVFTEIKNKYSIFDYKYDFITVDNPYVMENRNAIFDVSVLTTSYCKYMEKKLETNNDGLDGISLTVGEESFFVAIKHDEETSCFYPAILQKKESKYQITKECKGSGSSGSVIYLNIQVKS